MFLKYNIVAHIERSQQALKLAETVHGEIFVDDGRLGAVRNHMRALEATGDAKYVCILEDDAMPVEGFTRLVEGWLERFPDRLSSFYLGTGRPPQYQDEIDHLTSEAIAQNHDWIKHEMLLHGVCYVVPSHYVPKLLKIMENSSKPADFRLGWAWKQLTGLPIIYSYPSFVDHYDGPSLEKHPDGQPRKEVRKARFLYKKSR